MSYRVQCSSCGKRTPRNNIVELIEQHTDHKFGSDGGYIKCLECNGNAYVYRKSKLQEKEETWERYIKGVIRIPTGFPTYSPFVFLAASDKDDEANQVQFLYYKDTRAEEGGTLKHGTGPGGGPALTQSHLLDLIDKLIVAGFLSLSDVKKVVAKREQ